VSGRCCIRPLEELDGCRLTVNTLTLDDVAAAGCGLAGEQVCIRNSRREPFFQLNPN